MPRCLCTALVWMRGATVAVAQEPLVVATKSSAPFAFRSPSGEWTGISIDLLHELARRLEVRYELREVETPEQLVAGVASGDFDLGIAAISVTAEREEKVDFSHPYFATGLGVAVRSDGGSGVERIVRGVFSWPFLTLVGSVLRALVAAGYLFWLFEHRRNPQFAESQRRGVSNGLWWSTIMLLGHKGIFPASVAGRVLAASSMLVSILLLSVLTGAIASALTVGHFEAVIRDHHDLRHVRAFAVDGTSGAEFLRRERIAYESVPNVEVGLRRLADGVGDALVHDAPLLEYEVARGHAGALRVLPETFELQDYAVTLPQQSPLRERLNHALLQVRASPLWEQILFRYLQR